MTIVIKEMMGGRSFASSGKFTASRKFIGYEDEVDADGLRINAEAMNVLLASGMPRSGQSHPDAPQLFADTYNMTQSVENVGVWEVTWEYNPDAVGSDGDNPLQPDEEADGHVDLSVESNFTIVDIYKTGSTDGVDKDTPGEEVDIGGTLVALMGNPISKALPTTTINITQEVIATEFNMYGILKKSGKRNASPWLGLDAGTAKGILAAAIPRNHRIWVPTNNMSKYPSISTGLGEFTPAIWDRWMKMLYWFEENNLSGQDFNTLHRRLLNLENRTDWFFAKLLRAHL